MEVDKCCKFCKRTNYDDRYIFQAGGGLFVCHICEEHMERWEREEAELKRLAEEYYGQL